MQGGDQLKRWAWARVDLSAIADNVRVVRAAVAPSAVWAVVKADAYGHGAEGVARAALGAGAAGLCVALVEEGVELRRAGIGGPVLILSEQPIAQFPAIVAHGLTPTLYSPDAIDAFARAVGGGRPCAVHLKIDTGMNRVGARPGAAVALADAISAHRQLRLEGVFTHLATADDPDSAVAQNQLERFDGVLGALAGAGHRPPLVHAANSAGALALGNSRRDFVRLGIAMYGIAPGPKLADRCADLRPALSLHARVSLVKRVVPGDGISYGLSHVVERETIVATVPIGYADGVPRRLFGVGGVVLIHGRRLPIVGVVTMDQLVVDCGGLPDGVGVEPGDDVVLIGAQAGRAGNDAIGAQEWADRLGTIAYEIVCGISRRIERRTD